MALVNGQDLQLAMRQLRQHFSDPRVIGSMALVGIVLGLSGPFGTYSALPLVPRLAYWLAIVVATYGVGAAIAMSVAATIRARIGNTWLRAFAEGLVIGPLVTLAVMLINAVTFGPGEFALLGSVALLLNCTVLALVVSTISEMIAAATASVSSPVPPQTADVLRPPILERLPLPQRGRLLALTATDHYVEVLTNRGTGLLLMRLSDAMRETSGVSGLQIHRSHWVALDAVARVQRADGKAWVELTNGTRLPISRGFLPAAREAGLLVDGSPASTRQPTL